MKDYQELSLEINEEQWNALQEELKRDPYGLEKDYDLFDVFEKIVFEKIEREDGDIMLCVSTKEPSLVLMVEGHEVETEVIKSESSYDLYGGDFKIHLTKRRGRRDYSQPVKIKTKFGEVTLESLLYDRHRPGCREEEERICVLDSDENYLDYFSTDIDNEFTHPLFKYYHYEQLIREIGKSDMYNIYELLDYLCTEYEFVGTKEEMIEYLRNELCWEDAEEVVTKEKRNEYINRIGDYYILICD